MIKLLIILEYIFLPLLAIMASFAVKRKMKRNKLSLEEFLEDMNIDIKIICVLGLILYAISLFAHNFHSTNTDFFKYYPFMGIIIGLISYIFILQFHTFNPLDSTNKTIKFFGVRNSLYEAPAWYAIVLIAYVTIGILCQFVFNSYQESQDSIVFKTLIGIAITIISIFICASVFFYLLNFQTITYLRKENAHIKTFNIAYEGSDNSIRKYQLIIAASKKDDPILIAVYDRLYELFLRKSMFDDAEKCLNSLIELLRDAKINKNVEYLKDALREKLHFTEKHRKTTELSKLRDHFRKEFPDYIELLSKS